MTYFPKEWKRKDYSDEEAIKLANKIRQIHPNMDIGEVYYSLVFDHNMNTLQANKTAIKVFSGTKKNPRLKGHHKVYIIRTKSGIPLGAYGGQELAHRHAQRWADRTGEQIVMEVMGVPKK